MGNFEKLSVLVIVVIIVMILVVALYSWTDNPDHASGAGTMVAEQPATQPSPPQTKLEIPGPVKPTFPELPASKPGLANKPLNPLDFIFPQPTQPGTQPSTDLPPVPPPAPAAPRTHKVEPGDSFGKLAKLLYPGQVRKGQALLQGANPTVDPSNMRLDTILTVPELPAELATAPGATPAVNPLAQKPPTLTIAKGGTYVVKKGDTLMSISKRAYGSADRWQDIWLANYDAIDDVDHPTPGTRLKISH